MTVIDPSELSDDDLIVHLQRVWRRSRECTVELIRSLLVVRERRLHLKTAHPTLFEFCTRKLGMCDSSASRYSTATKVIAQFPHLLARIEDGRLHLSTLLLMRHHLSAENVDALVEQAHGRTGYQVKELLASVAPRPDAPSRMRKLPTPRNAQSVASVEQPLEPLAPERYRVQFNADRETHDEIRRVRDLMRHSHPDGDLDAIMKYCIRAGLERLEARQRGLTRKRPPTVADRERAPTSRHVPRAVRRAVFERDGARCTFHDEQGNRCSSETLLELDHVDPYAVGGLHTPENLRVRCRPHNAYSAEKYFGKALIEQRIRARQHRGKSSTTLPIGSVQRKPSVAARVRPKTLQKTKEPRTSKARDSSDADGTDG